MCHVVSRRGIATHDHNLSVILELENPTNLKGLQVFMGHMSYYLWFMKDYAKIGKPMCSLINKFEWTKEPIVSFKGLKKLLASTLILRELYCDDVLHVHIEALRFSIGRILTQPREKKLDCPIYFSKCHLNKAKQNYTTERKCLVMIYSFKKI